MEDLEADFYAASSKRPRDSLWTTWQTLSASWGSRPLPMTPKLCKQVAASLKAGAYRSAANYFSRARQEHILHGYDIDANLALTIRQCARSILRSSGPGVPKKSFFFEELTHAD